MKVVAILSQIIIMLMLAPLVNGIIKKVKALTEKRKGAPVLQMYFDLYKLLSKDMVVSDAASWIFNATPWIVFATALTASLLVPISNSLLSFSFQGDLIMLIYLLALGKFFMTLAGLDTASTFGGMGSSREVMISAIMEPAFMVSLFTLGLVAKSTSIAQVMNQMQASNGLLSHPGLMLIFFAMLVVVIAETSRLPVDDPSTHLELTMVHEAMILEYSGRYLALMEWGAAIKQLLFITLLVNIFFPHEQLLAAGNMEILVFASICFYVLKVILASVLIAIIEVSTVKFRLFSVPNLAAISFILSFIGFLQLFVLGR